MPNYAASSLDTALNIIEKNISSNENAELARSNFTKENIKEFKGEPYERAMVYFYRGLSYLWEEDWDNARASFKGGLIQDSVAGEENYTQDFALFPFMSALASRCEGKSDLAEELFLEAKSKNRESIDPKGSANEFLIVETGSGPIKYGTGQYSEQMRFARYNNTNGPNWQIGVPGNVGDSCDFRRECGPALNCSGNICQAKPGSPPPPVVTATNKLNTFEFVNPNQYDLLHKEDIFFQATTRGGRVVDSILAGKANFKDSSKQFATNSINAAQEVMSRSNNYNYQRNYSAANSSAAAGLVLLLLAAASASASANTMPAADIRYWDSLPDMVYVYESKSPISEPNSIIKFSDSNPSVHVRKVGKCKIGWAREHDPLKFPPYAPNSASYAMANYQITPADNNSTTPNITALRESLGEGEACSSSAQCKGADLFCSKHNSTYFRCVNRAAAF
jgi:hypothetical protein